MRTKLILLLAVGLLSTLTLSAQQKIKVACIGNSITQGWGAKDMKNNTYPAILGALLGDKYEVKNYGIGGRTTLKKGDRPYTAENFFTESQEWLPNIVIIKLGTNDSKAINWDNHSKDFETDLTEIIRTYKNLSSKPKVYLCEPVFITDNPHKIRESVVSKEIIPIIHKVAEKTDVEVIELHETLKEMPHLLDDGVHPNDLGYMVIAKEVYDEIK